MNSLNQPDITTSLELLLSELESDVARAQTREQHLRSTLRVARLQEVLLKLETFELSSSSS